MLIFERMKQAAIYFFLVVLSSFSARAQNIKMDTSEFWKIIDSASHAAKGNLKTEEQTIVKLLENYTPGQIVEFEIVLRQILFEADHYNVLAAAQIIDGTLTSGLYLSFRCWLISQGKKIFDETIKNPEYLADIVSRNTETEFKDLLYLSNEAYQDKTHKTKEDNSFPTDVAEAKGLDYEVEYTPKGHEWQERDLPKMYPKLWAKIYK
jgi:hypothetical protein